MTDAMKGALDRVLGIVLTWALTWAATKGYITQSQVAELLPAILVLVWAGYGAWVNRPKAIVQSAAKVPGTVVLTTPELANATPDDENIIPTAASPAKIAKVIAATTGDVK